MKKIVFSIVTLFIATICCAQSFWPTLTVKDMNGRMKELSEYAPQEGVVLFVFWKTCCPNNITMLDELHEVWLAHNQNDMPIQVVLVSLDDQRSSAKVKPIVSANGWGWPVIMDKNGNLAKQYQIIMPPQWIAFDQSGREIFRSKVTSGFLDSAIYFDQLVTTAYQTK